MTTLSIDHVLATPVYSLLIEELPFSSAFRATIIKNRLKFLRIRYVAELLQRTEAYIHLAFIKNSPCGREIIRMLSAHDLSLGMVITDVPSPPLFKEVLAKARESHLEVALNLQKIAANEKLTVGEWLDAAKTFLTPAILGQLGDERASAIITGRIATPVRTYIALGDDWCIGQEQTKRAEKAAVNALKIVIRSKLLNGPK